MKCLNPGFSAGEAEIAVMTPHRNGERTSAVLTILSREMANRKAVEATEKVLEASPGRIIFDPSKSPVLPAEGAAL